MYFKELLDYSTLNKTFCYYVESLFHTNHFDEILSLTSNMLDALYKKHGEAIADSKDGAASDYMLTECSIVLKLITAEVKVMTGLGNEAIEDLYALEQLLLSAVTSPAHGKKLDLGGGSGSVIAASPRLLQQWRYVVLMMKINVCIRQRHFDTAIKELIQITKLCASPSGVCSETSDATISNTKTEIVLLCNLTRLCIQVHSFLYFYLPIDQLIS